jgi:hypothetical protein
MNKPWGPDLLYGLVLERWFGPHTAETRSFRQIGVDKYKKTHGISLLYTLINFYIPIFVLVVVLLLLLFISDKSEKYCFKFLNGPLKHLRAKLIWNSLIRFCIETYYVVCMSMWISVKSARAVTDQEKLESVITLLLFLYCVGLPYGIYRFLRSFRPLLG